MTTKQLEYTSDELLTDHDFDAPLIVNGKRCHGGFDDSGTYVSPRTKTRVPAIGAWDEQRIQQFGTPKLDIGLETWPTNFPNVHQTKFMLANDVREPTISELTRIGTVEGFGAMIRYSEIPDWQACFDEDVTGTAIAHLDGGLYEAHARDEAGHEGVAGHKEMWFFSRDVAFENPVTEDQTQLMLERMGIPTGDPNAMAKLRQAAQANRILPHDIPFELESLVNRMIRLLFIEISAFHAFAWAEEVLSDTELVAGGGEAAKLVSYIRADETPHVAYLGTVLSEMRDRTWVGDTGTHHDGAEMIETIWNAALDLSVGGGRQQFIGTAVNELRHAIDARSDADDLFEEFLSLGTVRQRDDGAWIDDTDDRAGVSQ